MDADVVAFLVFYVIVPAGLVVSAYQYPGERATQAWAVAHRLSLSNSNRPHVVAYLRRGRRYRALGGAASWCLGGSISFLGGATLLPGVANGPIPLALLGFFGGAVAAEVTRVRPKLPAGRRRAVLQARRIDDYLASWVRWLSWAASVLAVVLGTFLLYLVIGTDFANDMAEISHSTVALVSTIVLVAVVAVASEVAVRRTVAHPQPLVPADLLAADDAMRTSSVSIAAGAGIMVGMLGLGSVTWTAVFLVEGSLLRWVLVLGSLSALGVAVLTFVTVFGPGPSPLGRRRPERSHA